MLTGSLVGLALSLSKLSCKRYPKVAPILYKTGDLIDILSLVEIQGKKLSNINSGAKTTNIVLTTAGVLPRNQDYEVIQLITSESVIGMNIVRDFFAGLSDFFGGRSSASQKVLKELREDCLAALREEAGSLGADAVIAVDLDYSEFSGKGKSMLFLVASGTAVRFVG